MTKSLAENKCVGARGFPEETRSLKIAFLFYPKCIFCTVNSIEKYSIFSSILKQHKMLAGSKSVFFKLSDLMPKNFTELNKSNHFWRRQ
jgi:hypothetical protein